MLELLPFIVFLFFLFGHKWCAWQSELASMQHANGLESFCSGRHWNLWQEKKELHTF
jgi:hypothetical protein